MLTSEQRQKVAGELTKIAKSLTATTPIVMWLSHPRLKNVIRKWEKEMTIGDRMEVMREVDVSEMTSLLKDFVTTVMDYEIEG